MDNPPPLRHATLPFTLYPFNPFNLFNLCNQMSPMKRPLLLLPLLALAAAPCLAQDPATNGPAATMLKEVLFPDARAPVWKFQPFGWSGETNVSTDVSPVEPPSPPFDLIGTWCHTNADFLIRMRIAGDGIQPIAELWWSTDKRNSNQGHLYIDWTPGKTEIAAGIEPHPDSASGLVLDFWSWETKLGDKLGPGMHNADFGESPVFASVCGKPVHPFAVSCSSSNGTLQASTWSDPSVVATKPVFQIDADRIRSENGKAAPGAMLEKELRSFPTPTADLENAPMGEIIDLIGHPALCHPQVSASVSSPILGADPFSWSVCPGHIHLVLVHRHQNLLCLES